jgi:hypothetical protein
VSGVLAVEVGSIATDNAPPKLATLDIMLILDVYLDLLLDLGVILLHFDGN